MDEKPTDGWSMLTPDELKQACQTSALEFPIIENVQALDEESQFHKALADPTRLRVVALLAVTDLCLCQLVDALSVPSSTMAHHLQMLERGGVLNSKREGKFTVYSLHPDRRATVLQPLYSAE